MYGHFGNFIPEFLSACGWPGAAVSNAEAFQDIFIWRGWFLATMVLEIVRTRHAKDILDENKKIDYLHITYWFTRYHSSTFEALWVFEEYLVSNIRKSDYLHRLPCWHRRLATSIMRRLAIRCPWCINLQGG